MIRLGNGITYEEEDGTEFAIGNGMSKTKQIAEWQKDPGNITTPNVQIWQHTMMGTVSSECAVEMVRAGTHFVICCQAIQELSTSGMSA